ncbi:MAG: N-acetyltransferase family protein [Pseudomonadota bacterium]
MNIRFAKEEDWATLIDIYNQAVDETGYTADLEPITLEERLPWLRQHTPDVYPIYVAEAENDEIAGWCSISAYRTGREALRFTAEISYYIDKNHWRKGVASRLVEHAINDCPRLGIKSLFGILLDINVGSMKLLEKFGFERWGHMPNVADINGKECGHLYMGRRFYD